MQPLTSAIVTREQAQTYLADNDINDPLPRKGRALWIVQPRASGKPNVRFTTASGTGEKRTYLVEIFAND